MHELSMNINFNITNYWWQMIVFNEADTHDTKQQQKPKQQPNSGMSEIKIARYSKLLWIFVESWAIFFAIVDFLSARHDNSPFFCCWPSFLYGYINKNRNTNSMREEKKTKLTEKKESDNLLLHLSKYLHQWHWLDFSRLQCVLYYACVALPIVCTFAFMLPMDISMGKRS